MKKCLKSKHFKHFFSLCLLNVILSSQRPKSRGLYNITDLWIIDIFFRLLPFYAHSSRVVVAHMLHSQALKDQTQAPLPAFRCSD